MKARKKERNEGEERIFSASIATFLFRLLKDSDEYKSPAKFPKYTLQATVRNEKKRRKREEKKKKKKNE